VRASASDERELQELAAKVMGRKVAVLANAKRSDEAIVLGDSLVQRTAESDMEVAVESVVASVAQGTALFNQGRLDEALAVFGDVLERLADTADPELRGQAGLALMNRAAVLASLGRVDEAMEAQEAMGDRYGEDTLALLDDEIVRLRAACASGADEQLAGALLRRVQALVLTAREEEARHDLEQLSALDLEDDGSDVASAARMLREQLGDQERGS
jgi:tetratricopeptide (TPR) repeat protein